jgi:hypothetical protein
MPPNTALMMKYGFLVTTQNARETNNIIKVMSTPNTIAIIHKIPVIVIGRILLSSLYS